MEVTKLLTEQILIRDSLKLSRFELALHIFEVQRAEGKPGFYSSIEEINSNIQKDQNEAKKLMAKQNKYIANTKQENYLFMQNNNQKAKKNTDTFYY